MRTDLKPATGTDQGNTNSTTGPRHPQIWVLLVLLGMLAVLFHEIFRQGYVMFSNDGPLGPLTAEMNSLPGSVKGLWQDQNWLGSESIAPPVSLSSLLRFLLGPVGFAKFVCPFAILVAGLGAFFCFRRLKLSPWACILGALAAAMNSDFFSTSCWGVATQVIGFGAMFTALGFLAEPQAKWSWLRVVLAGTAVGVGVMESYDIGGMMFSPLVAAFVVYQTLFLTAKVEPAPVKIGRSVLRASVVALCALLIAMHTLMGLWGTQIAGIAGAQQDEQIKAFEWAQKTAWSVPTPELFQVAIPGVFGYRMNWHMYENDQPKDDRYWGSAPTPIGTGYYAGVLVVMVALWALLQSLRTRGSPFTIFQRRAIWFWGLVMVLAALLAIGKNAPFYQFLYAVPFYSTIRNPQKFMHVFSWALIIVFAYGVHGLVVGYMQKPVELAGGLIEQFKTWRAKAQPFERWWFAGSVWAIVVSLLAWLIYASSNSTIQAHIKEHGIDPQAAPGIASFSIYAMGCFVILFVVTTVLLGLICSGQFSGGRARWGAVLLGAFLVFDLGRADAPWVVFWDTNYKYASDPTVTFLADKPYEHRVSLLPIQISAKIIEPLTNAPDQYNAWIQQFELLQNAYNSAWKQNLFPYHNIQCIDDIQEPRAGVDKRELQGALPPVSFFNFIRWWQLSNTRYILGPGPQVIHALDPGGKTFRVVKGFDLQPKRTNANFMATEDWVSVENTNGRLGVTELVDALPRAKLFTKWQISPDDDATLRTLASGPFEPRQLVLVSNTIPKADPANADKDPGTVEINTNYVSKRVEMQADVKVPAVLLLADRYNPKWHAWVDGKPVDMLRCNFITRGVYLEPGKHTVVMRYIAPSGTLWVTVVVIAVGLLLWGFVAINSSPEETMEPVTCAVPPSAETKK